VCYNDLHLQDGQQYGDEYLAELDYIEVVERQKEGYESDVAEDEDDEVKERDDEDDDDDESHLDDMEGSDR
jgi:histone-lysine N-methyltransferase SETDB1